VSRITQKGRHSTGLLATEDGFIVMTTRDDLFDAAVGRGLVDVLAETSYQLFPLGTKCIRGDQVWRYCKAGSTGLDIAAPVQSAALVHAEQEDDIVCGAAAAIGDTEVEITSTANLDGSPNDEDNDFRSGYLIVNDVTGEGQCKKIKSNEGFATTADSTFVLYDKLTIALTTSSQLGLVRSPYYKVIATAAVVSGCVVGVPQFAVTANYWFWCQTGGVAAVVAQAAIAKGTEVVVGTSAGKADPAAAATTEVCIGHPYTAGIADTESMLVFLTLDR
tara:strand:- start:16049 stop:16876 length:828 start_codon:yes stop_codon:yes gene_type:complete